MLTGCTGAPSPGGGRAGSAHLSQHRPTLGDPAQRRLCQRQPAVVVAEEELVAVGPGAGVGHCHRHQATRPAFSVSRNQGSWILRPTSGPAVTTRRFDSATSTLLTKSPESPASISVGGGLCRRTCRCPRGWGGGRSRLCGADVLDRRGVALCGRRGRAGGCRCGLLPAWLSSAVDVAWSAAARSMCDPA